jgi:uncharacterized protein YwgA
LLEIIRKLLYNVKKKEHCEMTVSISPTPEGWVLAFFYAGNPERPEEVVVSGKLLFIKEFFVFVKEIKQDLDEIFKFIPYTYGPYSFELVTILDRLIQRELVSVSTFPVQSGVRYDYKLTSKGIETARPLYANLVDKDTKSRLEKLRMDGTKMGYSAVLRYVYSRYPEYTAASKIKDDIR